MTGEAGKFERLLVYASGGGYAMDLMRNEVRILSRPNV
jgi:hypothetical protein